MTTTMVSDNTDESTTTLLLDLSAKFLDERRFGHAESVLRRALGRLESSGDLVISERAVVHHRLAHVERVRRNYIEAERHATRALNLHIVAGGRDHLASGAESAALGALVAERGRPDDAETMLRHGLWAIENHAGHETLAWGIVAHDLAAVFDTTGHERAAVELYALAFEVKRAVLGASHPSTLLTLRPLAEIEGRDLDLWTQASMALATPGALTSCAVCALDRGPA